MESAVPLGMTPKQAELLAFLRKFSSENGGVMPSFDQMATGLGLRSKASIARILDGLEECGLIRRRGTKHRAIEILEAPDLVTPEVRAELSAYCIAGGYEPSSVVGLALRGYFHKYPVSASLEKPGKVS